MKALTKVIAQQQQGAAGTKFTSVGAQFATSLGVLMKTIMSTSPHYIRYDYLSLHSGRKLTLN